MNLIGKIFVISIFVLSLVFMSFAIALFATQKNWREVVVNEQAGPDKPLGLTPQLRNEQKHNEELKTQLKSLIEERDRVKNAREQALAKLQTELDIATRELQRLDTEYAALEKKTSESVTAMNATQAKVSQYSEELAKLRAQILEAQNVRDDLFKDVVQKTDELNQAVSEKEQLQKRMEDLAKDLAKAKKLN